MGANKSEGKRVCGLHFSFSGFDEFDGRRERESEGLGQKGEGVVL